MQAIGQVLSASASAAGRRTFASLRPYIPTPARFFARLRRDFTGTAAGDLPVRSKAAAAATSVSVAAWLTLHELAIPPLVRVGDALAFCQVVRAFAMSGQAIRRALVLLLLRLRPTTRSARLVRVGPHVSVVGTVHPTLRNGLGGVNGGPDENNESQENPTETMHGLPLLVPRAFSGCREFYSNVATTGAWSLVPISRNDGQETARSAMASLAIT